MRCSLQNYHGRSFVSLIHEIVVALWDTFLRMIVAMEELMRKEKKKKKGELGGGVWNDDFVDNKFDFKSNCKI